MAKSMSETEHRDERRKLTESDYKRVRFMVNVQDFTIRETATAVNCSTKYVKRLLNQVVVDVPQTTVCSGCNYTYTWIDIQNHWLTWTSGGTHSLACGSFAP